MTDHPDDLGGAGYWPSVTDLFITLFIITVAVLATALYVFLPKNTGNTQKAIVIAVGVDFQSIRNPINRLREPLRMPQISQNHSPDQVVSALRETCNQAVQEISKLRNQQTELAKQIKELKDINDVVNADRMSLNQQLNDKPPIIRIDEQLKEYRFESGSADIAALFSKGLRENEFKKLADEIVERAKLGRVKVDTLEIIGHTDVRPLANKAGNLDEKLPDLMAGKAEVMNEMQAGSNNDLGLLRALAVKYQWKIFISQQSRPEPQNTLNALDVRCYSAGQTIPPNANPKGLPVAAEELASRSRRIEMRLTRLQDR